MNTWKFGPHRIYFTSSHYSNGDTAIQAWHQEGTSTIPFAIPYARISVNIEDAPRLPEGQFFLKHWSKNTAIAAAMIAEGLIEKIAYQKVEQAEFVTAHAYQFTEKGRQYCQ